MIILLSFILHYVGKWAILGKKQTEDTMTYDKELTSQRMAEWVSAVEHFNLPDWENLPQLELYMDQVIILLTQYLEPLNHDEDEKAVTASIINNYVRMKVMPPPVKKKYSRVHLACLIIICILKQSLSISCIQRMLPEDRSEEAVRRLYNDFVRQYHTVSQVFLRHVQPAEGSLLLESGESPITSSAVISNLSKSLTEYLLPRPEDYKE